MEDDNEGNYSSDEDEDEDVDEDDVHFINASSTGCSPSTVGGVRSPSLGITQGELEEFQQAVDKLALEDSETAKAAVSSLAMDGSAGKSTEQKPDASLSQLEVTPESKGAAMQQRSACKTLTSGQIPLSAHSGSSGAKVTSTV